MNPFPKDNIYSIQNDTVDNEDDLNYSDIMEMGEIKQINTIRRFKYNKLYVLDIMGGNFQYKLLKESWIMKKV